MNIAGIAIIVILAIAFLIGFKRGFLSQIVGFLGGFVALIVAALLCKPVADLIIESTPWLNDLAAAIADGLNLPDTEIEAQNLTAALTDMALPAFLQESITSLAESINANTVNISLVVSQTLARYIIIFIAFIVLMIVVKLLSKLLKGVAEAIRKAHVIGLLDGLLGAVLGLISGAVIVYFLLFVINIIPIAELDVVRQEIASSEVAKFFSENNLVGLVISLIAAI